MARGGLAGLRAEFRAYLGDIVFAVEEYADEETLAALGIDHPLDLSGLYHGRPVGEKSSMDSRAMPDRTFLYRRAILAEWVATGVRPADLVWPVLWAETAHPSGCS